MRFRKDGTGRRPRRHPLTKILITSLTILLLLPKVISASTLPERLDYGIWDAHGEAYNGEAIYAGCLVLAQTKLFLEAGVYDAKDFTPSEMMDWLASEGLIWGRDPWMGSGWENTMAQASKGKLRYLGSQGDTLSPEEKKEALVQLAQSGKTAILALPGHYVLLDAKRTKEMGEPYILDSLPGFDAADRQAQNRAPLSLHYSLSEILWYEVFALGEAIRDEQSSSTQDGLLVSLN